MWLDLGFLVVVLRTGLQSVKRRQVVNEMLTTEQSYVDVLLLLEQVTEHTFCRPTKNARLTRRAVRVSCGE